MGGLRPNDNGLFDMHGNLFEWCQDLSMNYPLSWKGSTVADNQDNQENMVLSRKARVIRGGSFYLNVWNARSAYRIWFEPVQRYIQNGVRPVRTFIP